MRTNLDLNLTRLVERPESSLARRADKLAGKLGSLQDGKDGKDGKDGENLRLKEAAREFEALLLEQLVKEMRKAAPKSDLFGEEKGRELYQEMLDGEFVRVMSNAGGIGLADFIVRSFDGKGVIR